MHSVLGDAHEDTDRAIAEAPQPSFEKAKGISHRPTLSCCARILAKCVRCACMPKVTSVLRLWHFLADPYLCYRTIEQLHLQHSSTSAPPCTRQPTASNLSLEQQFAELIGLVTTTRVQGSEL